MALGFATNEILGLITHDKLAEGWPTWGSLSRIGPLARDRSS
jgi:hypothetical protein